MVYATFEYYRDTYLGQAVAEADWPRLALRASAFLDYYTRGRAAEHRELEAVKMACCALAEQVRIAESAAELAGRSLAASDGTAGGEIERETVGAYSVTRRTGGESALAAAGAETRARARMGAVAREYLAGTGLVGRSGRCCGCTRPTP